MRLTRYHAEEWKLDPDRIGVFGASAGGHLASTLATQHQRARTVPDDPVDAVSARPDFQALLYPVISFGEAVTHSSSRRNLIGENPSPELVDLYSNELHVTPDTPPAFLVTTYDDHTLLQCELHTGRTHQIRVHLAYIGTPIVGDKVYGRRKQTIRLKRHFLHAAVLRVKRPSDNEELTLHAELPPELEAVLQKLAE